MGSAPKAVTVEMQSVVAAAAAKHERSESSIRSKNEPCMNTSIDGHRDLRKPHQNLIPSPRQSAADGAMG
jgi:hypothetical protein